MREKWQMSVLFQHLEENVFHSNVLKYKRVSKNVVLDGRLSPSDILVYLAILFHSNFFKAGSHGEFKKLNISLHISGTTNVSERSVIRAIVKLEEYGYIKTIKRKYETLYKVLNVKGAYVKMTLKFFNNAPKSVLARKVFVKELKAMFFVMNNDALPFYNTCRQMAGGKMDRRYYRELIKVTDARTGVVALYNELNSIS